MHNATCFALNLQSSQSGTSIYRTGSSKDAFNDVLNVDRSFLFLQHFLNDLCDPNIASARFSNRSLREIRSRLDKHRSLITMHYSHSLSCSDAIIPRRPSPCTFYCVLVPCCRVFPYASFILYIFLFLRSSF